MFPPVAGAYLPRPSHLAHLVPFAVQLRAWTRDLVVLTNAAFELPGDTRTALDAAGVRCETAAITRLVAKGDELQGIELGEAYVAAARAFVDRKATVPGRRSSAGPGAG